MNRLPSSNTLQRVCHRYGPGRLPKAENRAIGAGYAAATAAFTVALCYAVTTTVVEVISAGVTDPNLSVAEFALAAVPVVVPAAFATGVVGWKLYPLTTSRRAVVAGVAGTLMTYVTGFIVLSIYAVLGAVPNIPTTDPLFAVQFSFVLTVFGFLFTFWLTVPVGCISAVVYQNVVSERSTTG